MPTSVTRDIAAPRTRVWEVMADGWTYSQWVVGNSRMRAVDSDWPAVGTRILHSIGVWPAVIDDETLVLSSTPQQELVLLARLGPLNPDHRPDPRAHDHRDRSRRRQVTGSSSPGWAEGTLSGP